MEIHQLAPDLSVSAQILPQQLAAVRAAGFLSIICNCPDGEGGDQALFADIERAAQALGMPAHYLPAESGNVTDGHGAAFAAGWRKRQNRYWLTAAPACARPPCGHWRRPPN